MHHHGTLIGVSGVRCCWLEAWRARCARKGEASAYVSNRKEKLPSCSANATLGKAHFVPCAGEVLEKPIGQHCLDCVGKGRREGEKKKAGTNARANDQRRAKLGKCGGYHQWTLGVVLVGA